MKQYRIKADKLIKYGIYVRCDDDDRCAISDFSKSAMRDLSENLYRLFFDDEAISECLIRFFRAAFYGDIDLRDEVEMLCADLVSGKQINASKYKLMHRVVLSIQERECTRFMLSELPLRDYTTVLEKFGDIVLDLANELEIVDYDGEF